MSQRQFNLRPANGRRIPSLLRLPAELRLLMVENLISPLETRQTNPAGSTYQHELFDIGPDPDPNHERSMDLLWSCQQLYQDGRSVLYRRKSCNIDFNLVNDNHNRERLDCHISFQHCTGNPTAIPANVDRLLGDPREDASHSDLLGHAIAFDLGLQQGVIQDPTQVREFTSFVKFCRALVNFESFQVTVEYKTQEHVFLACQFLKQVLRGKNLKLRLLYKDSWATCFKDWHDTDHSFSAALLRACQILRCNSIQFQGHFCPHCHYPSKILVPGSSPVPCQTSNIWCFHDLVARIVESNDPVKDCMPQYLDFLHHVVQNLPVIKIGNQMMRFEQYRITELEGLKKSMFNYNQKSFRQRYRETMVWVKDWSDLWCETEVAFLKSWIRAVRLDNREMRRTIDAGLRQGRLDIGINKTRYGSAHVDFVR